MTAYDYIERAYGLTFDVGQRVTFVEDGCEQREGVVSKPIPSAEHYVAVLFDGDEDVMPCHPRSVVGVVVANVHDGKGSG